MSQLKTVYLDPEQNLDSMDVLIYQTLNYYLMLQVLEVFIVNQLEFMEQ